MVAHGNVEFQWSGNILIYKLQGAFNEQGLMLLVKERQQQLESKNYSQWFRIIYLHDDALMSADLFKKSVALELKSKNEGCLDTIYVVPNESLRRYRQHYETSLGGKSIYCDSIEEAIAVFSTHAQFITA